MGRGTRTNYFRSLSSWHSKTQRSTKKIKTVGELVRNMRLNFWHTDPSTVAAREVFNDAPGHAFQNSYLMTVMSTGLFATRLCQRLCIITRLSLVLLQPRPCQRDAFSGVGATSWIRSKRSWVGSIRDSQMITLRVTSPLTSDHRATTVARVLALRKGSGLVGAPMEDNGTKPKRWLARGVPDWLPQQFQEVL